MCDGVEPIKYIRRSLMLLRNWCSIHARCSKSSLKYSIRFCGIFLSLKLNFMVYRSSKLSSCLDCIFAIHQLWQSGFSRVYSNCCCSYLFKPAIITIGQSSHKMCSNNIVNLQESGTIINACTKKVLKLIEGNTKKSKSEEDSKPYPLLYWIDRLEYSEKFCRLEETHCYSDFS